MRFSINFIRPTDGSLLLTFDPYQTSATGGSSFTQKIARVLPHCMACVFIAIAAAVVLTMAGPFGTLGMANFWTSVANWLGLIATSLVIALMSKRIISILLGTQSALVREFVVVVMTTCVFTPVLHLWLITLFSPPEDAVPSMGYLFLLVLLICLSLSVLMMTVSLSLQGRATPEIPEVQPRLSKRLPDAFSGRILRLTAQGHSVMIQTTEGTFDVRMRLADAIDEMTDVHGFSTHRSHWVVADAVADAARDTSGKPHLRMVDGALVPVSRSYVAALEDEGVI
ncbi:LytTR family DNA-binding domain-containing protein [Ascidiaceihabitans sp.]|uniref:LytTR family DNA-binding domain-containing protein n=1 Tax=Ascidiaceihabitans sp. TaxID=1872644 RepID=UPI0032989E1B